MDAATQQPTAARTIARVGAVALLASWVIGMSLANLIFLWQPPGTFGMRADYDGRIKGVTAGLPAARAGLLQGDVIDLQLTSKDARNLVLPAKSNVPVGTTITLWIMRRAGPAAVALTSSPLEYPRPYQLAIIARRLATLVFLIVGAVLVLLRPGPATWGFYLFCVGLNPQTFFVSLSRYPSAASNIATTVLDDMFISAGVVGLLLFGLRFANDDDSGWRGWAERSVPYLFVVCAALTMYPDYANLALGLKAETVQTCSLLLRGAILALAVAALLGTYARSPGEIRQRIVWVVVGLLAGVVGIFTADVLVYSNAPFEVPIVGQSLLLLLSVALPLAVAYAVIRHRMFDVRFVINRALTYGILTAMIVLIFSVIDYLIGQVLLASRLATAVEIVVAVLLSYYLAVLDKRLENFTERVFFRQRHEAELRLRRVGNALPNASSIDTVDGLLQSEPADALALASAAVFRKGDEGAGYIRRSATGWGAGTATLLDADDRLVLVLASEMAPVRTFDLHWQRPDLPSDAATPVLAVPVIIHNALVAVALYGAHVSGEDLDPNEVRSLEGLAEGARTGYEHVAAEQLRQENEALAREVAALRAALGRNA